MIPGRKLANIYLSSQIINLYVEHISDFLAIIPYFIRKALLKKAEDNITNIKNEDNKNTHNSNLIYNNRIKIISKEKKKKIILFCVCLAILDFLNKISYMSYNLVYPHQEIFFYSFSCIVPFEIILQFICSYFILKVHMLKFT